MANKTDKLIVNNIKNTLFVIPFYQRGYRWTAKNVNQLLSDLLAFKYSGESEYCLQPIVLQAIDHKKYSEVIDKEEKVMRVVDGQQRLTTIAIILDSLGIETSWDIYYDTEEKRLSKILKEENDSDSINTYFRNEVRNASQVWFQINGKEQIEILFSPSGKSQQQIVFLEYDIDAIEGEDTKKGHDAFLRLNDGKTPLTSSELIRALYMVKSSGLSEQQRMEISKEWEIIENSLQNDLFWLMFNARGLEDTPTRIDLLFALVLGISLRATKANPRIVFDELEDDKNNYDLEKVWNEVLRTFWWMQSCYEDVELCNYLSWIRAYSDISASTIYENWRKYPILNDFKHYVINTIQETKFARKILNTLDDVDYYWDKGELRKLFVLLNIFDCNNSNERFRFDLFDKCKGWDIEHIDSQTPNNFQSEKNQREWLADAWGELTTEQKKKFISNFGFQETLESFYIELIELDGFASYADYIVKLTQNEEDQIPKEKTNKLGNLALLNLSINRGYKNDIFPLKRKSIIDHVNNGTEFIPSCTIKAFSKFYTKSASRITSWQYIDYVDYYEVMNTWFKKFMTIKADLKEVKVNLKTINLRKDCETMTDVLQTQQLSEQGVDVDGRFMSPISFITFMDNYDVVIPKIQRLYVQGRLDKRGVKCLTGFASSLVNSVSTHTSLLLDFVYGIDFNGTKKVFYPLDGQQRLTTLLLLCWLCGKAKPNWSFKYESRRATEFFIKGLLSSEPPLLQKPDNYAELKQKAEKHKKEYTSLCREYIFRMPWFQKSWMCDSGISGMVEMLDSLYDKLLNIQSYNNLSIDSIDFLLNYLDVNRKSYDHIFLKMNSRGRELTEWDNINAVLNKYLPNSQKKSWPDNIQLWYELMWKKVSLTGIKDKDKIIRVDNLMLDVVALALDCCEYTNKATNTFELSKWLQGSDKANEFYDLCSILLSALEIEENDSLSYLIPNWTRSHRPRIPDFACTTNDIIKRFYQPLLVYYASTFSTDEQWIRVIWNLVENIGVDRSSFKLAIRLIKELSQGKDDILSHLRALSIKEIVTSYPKAQKQLQEELCKAQHTEKYQTIIEMESYAFFRGAIRFLYTNAELNEDWENFEIKSMNAKELIPIIKENRHTIKLFVPYVSKESLSAIFYNWTSNDDEDLRYILLDEKSLPYLHNFFLKNNPTEQFTLLHQDIIELCEKAFDGRGYLQTHWGDESRYVWTRHEKRLWYYHWDSFVVGNEQYKRISSIIDDSELFEIQEKQRNRRIGRHFHALYLNFKYKQQEFTLYGNNTICIMKEQWDGKLENPEDTNGFYCLTEGLLTEEGLIERLQTLSNRKNNIYK